MLKPNEYYVHNQNYPYVSIKKNKKKTTLFFKIKLPKVPLKKKKIQKKGLYCTCKTRVMRLIYF